MTAWIRRLLYSPYTLLYGIAILNLVVAYFYVEKSFAPRGDAYSYRDGMLFLMGQPTEDPTPFHRLLTTPLFLYSSLIASVFTRGLFSGIMAVNLIFYVLLIYVFYQLCWEVYRDRRIAMFSAILLISNYVVFNYGVNFIADIGGWVFYIAATWLGVIYMRNPDQKKWLRYAVVTSSVGFLF